MQKKVYYSYIIYIFLCFMLLIMPGCQKQSITPVDFEKEDTLLPATNAENIPIVFSDLVVEKEVRRILNKPLGDICEQDLLDIRAFGIEEEYDELDNVGTFGCVKDNIETLTDLKWLKNLKVLVLSGCNIKSLNGIEELSELELLYISRNNITSLDPIRNLHALRYLNCSDNDITDYTALSGLIKMEELSIGSNGMLYTDLSPLVNMTQLRRLSASWCGVADLSPLRNMLSLEYLQLHHNNVSDISILKHLSKINYLGLDSNKITDIKPISQLPSLETLHINGNLIPEEDLNIFYLPKEEDYFITVFHESICDEMPPFTFELRAWNNKEMNAYSLDTLTISNDSDLYRTQIISLPELSLFGQTAVSVYDRDMMGFELEDVNFDGYKDIRLFDTSNGNYLLEWIYLVWNNEKAVFEHAPELSMIPLASFDQEEKLIYGMGRGSAASHYNSTYQYIGKIPVMIKYYSEEGVYLDEEQIEGYFEMASIQAESTGLMCFHENESVRDEETGQMKVIRDEIVFYPDSESINIDEIIAKIPASSEIGQAILNRE